MTCPLLLYHSFPELIYTAPSSQESAAGLLYLHTAGIIHRDIKPANILVGGQNKNAKIADYGISRVATLDATMTIKGTLVYQSPELSRGERYGLAADIFSLALTMYEVCDRVRVGCFCCMKSGVHLCRVLYPSHPQFLPLSPHHRIFRTRNQRDLAGLNSRPM